MGSVDNISLVLQLFCGFRTKKTSFFSVFWVFSELGTKKTVVLLCFLSLGQTQTLEIQCFRDVVVLGQKKRRFFCVLGVFSELGTKKQWFYCVV